MLRSYPNWLRMLPRRRPRSQAALWAFGHSDSFEAGALLVANLGGDADTTAAIYGALAGAYYGEGGLPTQWIERLFFAPLLRAAAEALCEGGGGEVGGGEGGRGEGGGDGGDDGGGAGA